MVIRQGYVRHILAKLMNEGALVCIGVLVIQRKKKVKKIIIAMSMRLAKGSTRP